MDVRTTAQLQLELQEPDFECQGFLNIRMQPSLELLQHLQVLQGLFGREALRDSRGGGKHREIK